MMPDEITPESMDITPEFAQQCFDKAHRIVSRMPSMKLLTVAEFLLVGYIAQKELNQPLEAKKIERVFMTAGLDLNHYIKD